MAPPCTRSSKSRCSRASGQRFKPTGHPALPGGLFCAIGNPLNDGNWTYTWQNGRQLKSMSKSGTFVKFVYNENGLRVQKIIQPSETDTTNAVVTKYTLHGKNIHHMTQGDNELHFFYDAQNKPAVVVYNGTPYSYVKNLQGDIVAILDSNKNVVVSYVYDAWGRPISCSGTMATTLGKINPFRYRGYVFDEETGLYYLRSRYYESSFCRFIIPDIQAGCVGLICSHNMFIYCNNTPISFIDNTGMEPVPLPSPAPQITPAGPMTSPCPTTTPYPMKRPTPTPSPIPTLSPTPAPTIIPKPGMQIRAKRPSWNQQRIFNIFWNNNTLSTNSIIDNTWIDVFNSDIMWVEFHKTGRHKGNYRLKVTFGEKTVPTIWTVMGEQIGAFSDAEGFALASTYYEEGMQLQDVANGIGLMGAAISILTHPDVEKYWSWLFPLERNIYSVVDFEWEEIY